MWYIVLCFLYKIPYYCPVSFINGCAHSLLNSVSLSEGGGGKGGGGTQLISTQQRLPLHFCFSMRENVLMTGGPAWDIVAYPSSNRRCGG